MVDLAIKIAALLFLAWITLIIIAVAGKYIAALILIVGGVVLALYLLQDKQESPRQAQVNPVATPLPAPAPHPLGDRLRSGPPIEFAVPGGTARLIAAIESSPDRVRLIVSFRGDSGGHLLGNGMDAASLLKPALCLTDGYLSEFRDRPDRLTLVAYEELVGVSEQRLAGGFCK